MRTSRGPAPPVKGCVDTSSRPFSKEKPSLPATSRESAVCASGSHCGPCTSAGCGASTSGVLRFLARIASSSGTSPSRSSPKMASSRSARMPRSKASSAPSYGSVSHSEGRVTAATCFLSSNISTSFGANIEKSAAARASFQATKASLSSLASRSASSTDLRADLSKSSMASRTLARCRGSSSSMPLTASIAARISAPVRFSCSTFASAAFCAERDSAAPAGMKTCSSYESTPSTSESALTSFSSFFSCA